MSDAQVEFHTAVARALERYAPLVTDRGDWAEALHRAKGPRRQRRAVLSLAAVSGATLLLALATPLGGAIRQAVSDFSDWVAGTPGTPVSDEEQKEFDEENARSWIAFPGSPKLRRLIRTEVDGVTYDLVGFRSAGSLCIRIRASGAEQASRLTCAPVDELRHDDVPVRVLLADWGVGRGDKREEIGFTTYTSSRAQVTAGIAADGVEAIELVDDHGTHRVAATANAFLYVADRPDVGERVSQVRAEISDGGTVVVPFSISSFGPAPGFGGAGGEPGGPTKVEREVHGGTVGWIERREPRGEPFDKSMHDRVGFSHIEFGRLLTPDPGSAKRVAVTIGERHTPVPNVAGAPVLCTTVISRGLAGGGCMGVDHMFETGPFTFGYSTHGVGDQYATFAGLASDDVAQLELYTATGNRITVPLRDNAFLADVAIARLPAKMVAYDAQGRVIGIQKTGRDEGPARIIPGSIVDLKATVAGVGTVELRANKTREGGECWEARGTGSAKANTGSCVPKDWTFAPMRLGWLPDPAVFLFGRVRDDIRRITLRYADGATSEVVPGARGYLLSLIPESTDRRGTSSSRSSAEAATATSWTVKASAGESRRR
jgi:hypothetical protein